MTTSSVRWWGAVFLLSAMAIVAMIALYLRSRNMAPLAVIPNANSQTAATIQKAVPSPPNPTRIPDPWPDGRSPKAPSATGSKMSNLSTVPSNRRQSRSVEETGPDLSGIDPDALIDVMMGAQSERWGDARAAWELGNRHLYADWRPNAAQQARIDAFVSALVDDVRLGSTDFYATSRNQLYRLWSLAHPALVLALDPSRNNHDLVIKTLAATRTRELILLLIVQFHAETDPQRKRLLAFTLSCMKEQRRVLTSRRHTMDIAESEAVYAELIAPALAKQ